MSGSQQKAAYAKSLTAARQVGRIRSAGRGVRMVFDQSQWNICVRSSRVGGRLPAADRGNQSSVGRQTEMICISAPAV